MGIPGGVALVRARRDAGVSEALSASHAAAAIRIVAHLDMNGFYAAEPGMNRRVEGRGRMWPGRRRDAGGARAWGLALALVALAAVSLLAVRPSTAQPSGSAVLRGTELLAALRGGGFILYFRHTDTDHRQNDARMRSVEDCANQRSLTDRGRDQARAVGEAIRALGIPIGLVLASPLCRTVETATLAFGTVERSHAARDAGPAPPGSPERFAALRGLLSTVPPRGKNAVIVGHAYPFFNLVGGQYLDEGEAAVVQPGGAGFQVVGRVGLGGWPELAELPR